MKIINFDLINHECRGDKLEHDRRYYETLQKKEIDEELVNSVHKYHFASAAKRSELSEVHLEKDLQLDHLRVIDLKEQLKQKGIHLSNMQKRKKYTNHCKSLPF